MSKIIRRLNTWCRNPHFRLFSFAPQKENMAEIVLGLVFGYFVTKTVHVKVGGISAMST